MSAFIEEINEKTQLAGSNKLEILLFSLGTDEVFGINVFKIKEVTSCPKITRMPNMQKGVCGVFSLRGNVLPALDLSVFSGMRPQVLETSEYNGHMMIVTEYSKSSQGFIVKSIDRIIRVDWDKVKAAKTIMSSGESLITAITELESGQLVSILDVEQVLFDAFGEGKLPHLKDFKTPDVPLVGTAFFADDSGIARKKITEVLDHLSISYQGAENGQEAWERLDAMANVASAAGSNLKEQLRLILTDAEMPEMDGYVLTKKIKSDPRFEGIPVVMHSSLSSQANRAMGEAVGVDGYVAKFDPHSLADAIVARWRH